MAFSYLILLNLLNDDFSYERAGSGGESIRSRRFLDLRYSLDGNGGKQRVQIAAFHQDIVGREGKMNLFIAALSKKELGPGQNIGALQ